MLRLLHAEAVGDGVRVGAARTQDAVGEVFLEQTGTQVENTSVGLYNVRFSTLNLIKSGLSKKSLAATRTT